MASILLYLRLANANFYKIGVRDENILKITSPPGLVVFLERFETGYHVTCYIMLNGGEVTVSCDTWLIVRTLL
jgi:hypothetical protein